MELATLARRADGAKPWRKLFHASNGLLMAGALSFLDVPRVLALSVLGGLLVALAVMDAVRLRSRRVNEIFFRAFRPLVSPREAAGVASSTWYALGVLLTVALFSREASISGILVLALADPCASWVGGRWGRRPFLGATLEGTAVFLGVSLVLMLLRHPWPVALGAALVTTLAERFAWPVDDNLVVPLAGAAAVTLLGAVL